MAYYEKEILEILDNIKKTDYDYLKNKQLRKYIFLDQIFDKFRHYKKNKENKEVIKDLIKNYELIEDINELKKGDHVRQLNLRYFYDIRLMAPYYVLNVDTQEGGKIVLKNKIYTKTIKNTSILFRLLKKDSLVKTKLIEIVENL